MKFSLGQTLMTRGINDTIAENAKFAKEVTRAFNRYINCDWGEMCEEDLELNDQAVERGDDRILAAYQTSQGKIYIITEWDRSATTILFANEY